MQLLSVWISLRENRWTEQANMIAQMSKRNREHTSTVSPMVARVVFIWISPSWTPLTQRSPCETEFGWSVVSFPWVLLSNRRSFCTSKVLGCNTWEVQESHLGQFTCICACMLPLLVVCFPVVNPPLQNLLSCLGTNVDAPVMIVFCWSATVIWNTACVRPNWFLSLQMPLRPHIHTDTHCWPWESTAAKFCANCPPASVGPLCHGTVDMFSSLAAVSVCDGHFESLLNSFPTRFVTFTF